MLSVAGKSKDKMIEKLGLVKEDLSVIKSITQNESTPCDKHKDKPSKLFNYSHNFQGEFVDRKKIHTFRNEIWKQKNPEEESVGE